MSWYPVMENAIYLEKGNIFRNVEVWHHPMHFLEAYKPFLCPILKFWCLLQKTGEIPEPLPVGLGERKFPLPSGTSTPHPLTHGGLDIKKNL